MDDLEPKSEIPISLKLAGSLIFDKQGRFLLIHRKTDEIDQVETIGGKIDDGETAKVTAKKEAREETGLEIEIGEKIGELNSQDRGRNINYQLFAAKIISGTAKPVEPIHIEVRFWSIEELQTTEVPLSSNVRCLLDAISSGEISLPQ